LLALPEHLLGQAIINLGMPRDRNALAAEQLDGVIAALLERLPHASARSRRLTDLLRMTSRRVTRTV
jgi:hypothetical protein